MFSFTNQKTKAGFKQFLMGTTDRANVVGIFEDFSLNKLKDKCYIKLEFGYGYD